jgi:hypothetical protein
MTARLERAQESSLGRCYFSWALQSSLRWRSCLAVAVLAAAGETHIRAVSHDDRGDTQMFAPLDIASSEADRRILSFSDYNVCALLRALAE